VKFENNQPNKGPIKAVIFDWAGTTIDFGCFAPVIVFKKIFEEKGISLTMQEIRKPMGLMKKDHIRVLCQMERVKKLWNNLFNHFPNENDVGELYSQFEPTLLKILADYTEPIPGVMDTIDTLHDKNIKIGSTTGYTQSMMDIVVIEAAKKGYKPDSIINSSHVPIGRPYPFMCYLNAINLQVYPLKSVIKVGDTVTDIKEGLNAGMWSIGVIIGSSELGLNENQLKELDTDSLKTMIFNVRSKFEAAGAHYVIDKISDLQAIIDKINSRLSYGDFPEFPRNSYKLLTPGPITTSPTVKLAMMTDWGSRNDDYKVMVEEIRTKLVKLATKNNDQYTAILMQGSGTFSIESVLSSAIPPNGKLLVIVNGAYGKRITKIARVLGIEAVELESNEMKIPDLKELKKTLETVDDITHVVCIHSETTTGIINPIKEMAYTVKEFEKVIIVDAMSSFGAIPIDIGDLDIDFFISSPNKNLQGIPGFGIVIAKKEILKKCEGQARSYSLDLFDQWKAMEKSPGSWRFTSPVHVVRALHQALIELEEEGGIQERFDRYTNNQKILVEGMKILGFEPIPLKNHQGPIITTFYSPENKNFDFKTFYSILQENGFVIYPGKTTEADTFRIGTIGEVYPDDIKKLVKVIKSSIFW
jgi:2-aminoethylphosphonate--pyruvate transaminase/phosphonoacetaldehyde hydrolase